MKYSIYFVLAIVLTVSCKQKDTNRSGLDHQTGNSISTNRQSDSSGLKLHFNEYMVSGTLYQQKAAEYRALCYQAFNLGKLMIEKDLADKSIDKHRIVVLDIDETVLDNSPFQAKCILEGTSYPVNWDEWCNLSQAKAVPGAVEFLKEVRANGVGIYYITNRKAHLKDVTIRNLKNLGFPEADEEHVIMRTTENSKEPRRQNLLLSNHISLLFGDNLNDFSDVFEEKNPEDRYAEVDKASNLFGKKFILLPNAMYGDWESALYGYDQRQNDSVKSEIRHKALIAF